MKKLKCKNIKIASCLHWKNDFLNDYTGWCISKMPCGACIFNKSIHYGYKKLGCSGSEIDEFDCDNCLYKFLCLTNNDYTWMEDFNESLSR